MQRENITIKEAVVHDVPDGLGKVLLCISGLLEKWNIVTPFARHE